MSLFEPAYSLLTLLTAFVIGILIGRIAAARSSPHRAEQRRRREQAAKLDAADNLAHLSPETRERIERLAAEGHLIDAVRACREELDLGLKEARDVVNLVRTADTAAMRVTDHTVQRAK